MGLLNPGDTGAPAVDPVPTVDSGWTRLRRFLGLGVVAQVVVALVAHVSDGVLTGSGVLGTAIAFVLGLWYGGAVPDAVKDAATGGFLIGIVGVTVGIVVAVLLHDQTWMLLTFAPAASGITGLLGGAVGAGLRGTGEPPPSPGTDPSEGRVDAP